MFYFCLKPHNHNIKKNERYNKMEWRFYFENISLAYFE